MNKCENGDLIYDERGRLDRIAYCTEPGTEVRERHGRAKHFCGEHASKLDLFTAQLKVNLLKVWEERGADFMCSLGHVRPVLTAEEEMALRPPVVDAA